jgi:Ala-tRNA(Pro) deacylase
MTIREYLRNRSVPFSVILHAPAPSSSRVAQAVHLSGQKVAKAVLLRSGSEYLLAVLPATHRVSLGRLGEFLGTADLRLATEEELDRVFTDCEHGALPPFGKLYGVPTIVDSSLAASGEILIEGNFRHEGLRMRFRDYEQVEEPRKARFAEPTAPRRRRDSQKRAG